LKSINSIVDVNNLLVLATEKNRGNYMTLKEREFELAK
jgi:hypothetical protein